MILQNKKPASFEYRSEKVINFLTTAGGIITQHSSLFRFFRINHQAVEKTDTVVCTKSKSRKYNHPPASTFPTCATAGVPKLCQQIIHRFSSHKQARKVSQNKNGQH